MTLTDALLTAMALDLGEALVAKGARVSCVESCTGGWIAKTLTDVPGSSAWFGWGWVTYADDAKHELVGVPAETLAAHGAVSEAVVAAMAHAGRCLSGAEFAVAVSGIAGARGRDAGETRRHGLVCLGRSGECNQTPRIRRQSGFDTPPGRGLRPARVVGPGRQQHR